MSPIKSGFTAIFLLVTVSAVPVALAGGPAPRHVARHYTVTCPRALQPGNKAAAHVAALVDRVTPVLYRHAGGHNTFQISALGSMQPRLFQSFAGTPYHGIAQHLCGATVANRSWVVFLYFPQLKFSASLSQGVVFVARSQAGWRVWDVYH